MNAQRRRPCDWPQPTHEPRGRTRQRVGGFVLLDGWQWRHEPDDEHRAEVIAQATKGRPFANGHDPTEARAAWCKRMGVTEGMRMNRRTRRHVEALARRGDDKALDAIEALLT